VCFTYFILGGSNVSLTSRGCFGTLDIRDCLRLIVPSYYTITDASASASANASASAGANARANARANASANARRAVVDHDSNGR
jgi:hypothetical protein